MAKSKAAERDLQNFSLTALSEAETALALSTDAGVDKQARAHTLALLGIGYALCDLADQLAEMPEEE